MAGIGNISKNINNAMESAMSSDIDTGTATFKHLDQALIEKRADIDSTINNVLISISEFESIYNNGYLSEKRTKGALVNMILNKIERGYVDVK